MSEVVVTSVENMEQPAETGDIVAAESTSNPDLANEKGEKRSGDDTRDCMGLIACASCFFAAQCPRSEAGKAPDDSTEEYSLEKLLDDEGSIAEMTPLVVPDLLPSIEKTPESATSSKEAPAKDNKTPIVILGLTPKEQKMAGVAQSKTSEAPIVPIATTPEKQATIPQPEVEVPKKAPVENAPVDALHVIDRAVDRLPKFGPSNTPISSDTAIAAEQKPAVGEGMQPIKVQQVKVQQAVAAAESPANTSPIADAKPIIAVESSEVNAPVLTHETPRQVLEMPVDDSELAPHVAPPVTKSVRAAAPTESDVKAVHTEIANESTPSSQKLSHSPSPPAEPVESKPVATVVEVPSQESCEISEPVITHQDVVNEIEVEPMRLVEHSSQITLRNHYESVFGSLAAPSPSPQEIEISEPEIDSGYAECEMSMAPKQIEPQVVAPEQPIYAELAVVSQEKVQNSHNAVVKTTPFHAPPTTLDIALPIVNTLDLGLPAAPFEMGDRARPLRAPVDPPNLRNNPQPEFSPEIPEKTITATAAPLSFSEGSDIPEDLVEEEYVTQNVSSDVLKRSTPTKKSEGEQHDRTTPADEILLTDTQEPEPANQGYGISGLIGELSELIGKLACAVAVKRQRLRSEYDLIA